MENVTYQPYSGPAGPTEKQIENNTKFLAGELENRNILYKEDREYAEKMWGGNDLNLIIIHPITGKKAIVGYDRCGFCIDGINSKMDQECLESTVGYLKDWYFKL